MALTAEDRQVIEFAGRWYHLAGTRLQAMHDELGMTPTRYARILNRLLDDIEAGLEYPTITRQLRELRDRRLAQKAARP